MRIEEILREENKGKKYYLNMEDGNEWEVVEFNLEFDLFNQYNENIFTVYCLSEIMKGNYIEVVDWSKIPIDTKILVRDSEDSTWKKRMFCKYKDGRFYAWCDRRCSFTAYNEDDYTEWKYVKLYEEE